MRTFVRSIALMALIAGLVAGCGAAAPAATTTPAPTPIAQVATPAATPTPAPTPAPPDPTGTPLPTPTPFRSVAPMAPAYVTSTGTFYNTNPGTTTPEGDCTRIAGAVIEATGTTDDPRVAGTTRFTTNGPVCGVVGFQWGTMSTTNADGAWEGTCTGGMWGNGDVNDISCWLVGSGAYKGLTYYKHTRTAGLSFADEGVILPAPPPTTR